MTTEIIYLPSLISIEKVWLFWDQNHAVSSSHYNTTFYNSDNNVMHVNEDLKENENITIPIQYAFD